MFQVLFQINLLQFACTVVKITLLTVDKAERGGKETGVRIKIYSRYLQMRFEGIQKLSSRSDRYCLKSANFRRNLLYNLLNPS